MHERETEAPFLAGASIRLRSILFLRDAGTLMPDDKADEGRRYFNTAPERAGSFPQAVSMLDDVCKDLIATDQQLEQRVLRDACEPAPLLKEGTRIANALRRAKISELARGCRCAVFNQQKGGIIACAACETLPPSLYDQVEGVCVRAIGEIRAVSGARHGQLDRPRWRRPP